MPAEGVDHLHRATIRFELDNRVVSGGAIPRRALEIHRGHAVPRGGDDDLGTSTLRCVWGIPIDKADAILIWIRKLAEVVHAVPDKGSGCTRDRRDHGGAVPGIWRGWVALTRDHADRGPVDECREENLLATAQREGVVRAVSRRGDGWPNVIARVACVAVSVAVTPTCPGVCCQDERKGEAEFGGNVPNRDAVWVARWNGVGAAGHAIGDDRDGIGWRVRGVGALRWYGGKERGDQGDREGQRD